LIPGGVTGDFFRGNPDRTMCPGVDSASECEYQDFSWGKGGQCVRLTTYHPCSAETSRKSGALTYLEPLGPPQPVAGHLYFTLKVKWRLLQNNGTHLPNYMVSHPRRM